MHLLLSQLVTLVLLATTALDYPAKTHANWDAKSAKSYQSSYAGSQAHLNPYEMAQVPSPVPQLQYQGYAQGPQQPQQYPPCPVMYQDGSTTGWSVMREKLMKHRSVNQVQLFRGNLVLDVPVPSNITPAGKGGIEEFSKIRYMAATCDPNDFMSSRYSLRQYLGGCDTELFIMMTMYNYNEDEVLFIKTMNAWVTFHFIQCHNSLALPRNSVIKNIGHLCGCTHSKTWCPEGWKKVVVCIVSDGVKSTSAHFKSSVLYAAIHTLLSVRPLDVHLDRMLPRRHSKRFSLRKGCRHPYIRVRLLFLMLHVLLVSWPQRRLTFRYTTNVIVTNTGEVSMSPCPVQILFCLKEQSKKKLNSHRWFFNAFGPLLRPNGTYACAQLWWQMIEFFIFQSVSFLTSVPSQPGLGHQSTSYVFPFPWKTS